MTVRRLLLGLVALVVALLTIPAATAAPVGDAEFTPAFAYDGPRHDVEPTLAISGRGPPAAHEPSTFSNVGARAPRGTLVTLDASGQTRSTRHASWTELVQGTTGTTPAQVPPSDGDLLSPLT